MRNIFSTRSAPILVLSAPNMTIEQHKANIHSGLQSMEINALIENLSKVAAELDEVKAKLAELEKPSEPVKE